MAELVAEKANLKLRLVEIAIDILTVPRDAKLPTMRELAARAQVAPGAAYRHFKSQDELFLAVIERLFGDLEAALKEATLEAKSSKVAVLEIARAYVVWGLKNQGGYQLLFETTDSPDLKPETQKPGFHLIEDLARLIAGDKKSTASDFQQATRLWVNLHGLVSLRNRKTAMPWPSTIDEEIEIIVRTNLADEN